MKDSELTCMCKRQNPPTPDPSLPFDLVLESNRNGSSSGQACHQVQAESGNWSPRQE